MVRHHENIGAQRLPANIVMCNPEMLITGSINVVSRLHLNI